jgi:hypothetical protein
VPPVAQAKIVIAVEVEMRGRDDVGQAIVRHLRDFGCLNFSQDRARRDDGERRDRCMWSSLMNKIAFVQQNING